MKVVGVVRAFNLTDKFVVLGRIDGPQDEQLYATGQIIDGMVRETDFDNLTEFEVEFDGKVITSYRRIGDLTWSEYRERVRKAITARQMEGVA